MLSTNFVLLFIPFIVSLTNAKEFSTSIVCAPELEHISNTKLQPVDYQLMYGNKTTKNLAELLLGSSLVHAGVERIGIEELRLALDPKYREFLTDENLLDGKQSYFQRPASVNSLHEKTRLEIEKLRVLLKFSIFNPALIFSTYGLFTKEEVENIAHYMDTKYSGIRTCFKKQFKAVNEHLWNHVTTEHMKLHNVFSHTSSKLEKDLRSRRNDDDDED